MPSKAKWTVLTYIAAHNNLSQLGKRSLMEILKVGSTSDVVHGVLYDGVLPALHAGAAARYVMGGPGLVAEQQQLGSFDSGDPDALIATAKWLFEEHPAERYGVVLWSHGSGWEPAEIEEVTKEARPGAQAELAESKERSGAAGGRALFRTTLRSMLKPEKPAERAILFDDGTGHSLDTIELGRVAEMIAKAVGQPLDLVGMDACLMATLEVAYQVRNSVRYLVASEELVPGHSWPYETIFADLRDHPERTGAELATSVVRQYTDYYTANPPAAGDVTKVALDVGHIDKLAKPISELAAVLAADIDNQADLLWKAQVETSKKETRNGQRRPNKFSYDLWDIRTVAARLADLTANAAVRDAAQLVVQALKPGSPAVLAQGYLGAWFDGIGGVSIFMMPPGKQDRMSPYYAELALSTDTAWANMLCAYHAHYRGIPDRSGRP